MLWNILFVLLLVAANGFFVAAEFALVKVRATEFVPLTDNPGKSVRLAHHILGELDVYLSACQLGITLASLALGWVGEPLVASMIEPLFSAFGLPAEKVHYAAFPLAFGIITFLHLTVGEQAPKIGAIQKAHTTTLFIVYPLMIFYKVFKPFIGLINVSSNWMLRLVGLQPVSEHDQIITEEEVRVILTESAAMGHLKKRERRIIENVLDLEDKIARRHMVPRSQVICLELDDSMQKSLELASGSGHTRFPLCRGGLDNAVGIVHVKDVFNATTQNRKLTTLEEIARKPLFFPEALHLDVLLKEFQKSKNHLAILVDEHGSASGIISLENVIEEMIGQIEDEFDAEVPLVVSKGEGRFEVDATLSIDEFRERCGAEIPEGTNVDSVAGILIEMLGHIPRTGEKVRLGRHEITVLEAEPTRVLRVLVVRTKDVP